VTSEPAKGAGCRTHAKRNEGRLVPREESYGCDESSLVEP
jgi:hypothetical protein